MTVSVAVESTTPAALVSGPVAHVIGQSQGLVGSGRASVGEIVEEVAARTLVDREGDAIRRTQIWPRVERIAMLAKRAGAWEIHELAVEIIGLAAIYEEKDQAEDGHDGAIGGFAASARRDLFASIRLHGRLLGQREAFADDAEPAP